MKKLILLLTFTFLTALSFAGGNVPVKSFTLSGLNQFSGKSASIFYISGRSPGFATANARPRVRVVLRQTTPLNINNGMVSVPSTILMESGWVKYNYIQVVIHEKSQKNVAIKNLDGSVPVGQQVISTDSFKQIKSFFIPRSQINGSNIQL